MAFIAAGIIASARRKASLSGGGAQAFAAISGATVTASASIQFAPNGGYSATASPSGGASGSDWLTPITSGIGSEYSIRAQLLSGDTPNGTLNTWLPLTSARFWELSITSSGFAAATSVLNIQIRHDPTSTIDASATYALVASIEV